MTQLQESWQQGTCSRLKSPALYPGAWLWLCLVGFLGHLPRKSLSVKLLFVLEMRIVIKLREILRKKTVLRYLIAFCIIRV